MLIQAPGFDFSLMMDLRTKINYFPVIILLSRHFITPRDKKSQIPYKEVFQLILEWLIENTNISLDYSDS